MEVTTLLKDAANSVNTDIHFHAIQANTEGFRAFTTNTKWLSKFDVLDIGTVTDFQQNVSIDFKADSVITPGTYSVPLPTFVHGKLKAVNTELASMKNDVNITPLIWNFELQPRTLPSDLDTLFLSEGNVRLFFMASCDVKQYTIESDQAQTIEPLNNLVNSFIVALKKQKRAGKFFIANRINHSRFSTGGNSLTASDEKWVLGKYLSGIEIEISLPVKKDLSCPVPQFPEGGGAFSSGFSSGFDI